MLGHTAHSAGKCLVCSTVSNSAGQGCNVAAGSVSPDQPMARFTNSKCTLPVFSDKRTD